MVQTCLGLFIYGNALSAQSIKEKYMSLLDQAKKEAKRLFNLAKANQEKNQSQEIALSIPKLSAAREIVAVMNGYKNWHDYEEVLKRKDIVFENVDKNTENKEIKKILDNKKYFIQDIDFNVIENPNKYQKETKIIVKQEHQPVILGHKKERSFFDNKDKYWLLNQYPVLINGSTGAGKTEVLLSLGVQYIKNNEGFIYIDGKGENVLYTKIFSYAQQYNRLDDLYCLNFLSGSRNLDSQQEKKISHSIDPLNPMVGNDSYFEHFFSKEMGTLIHAILKKLHEKGQVMDTQSLESILMLNNLIEWKKENKFNELPELNDYLISIGLSLEEENDESDLEDALEKHALKCSKAYETVNLFKIYSYMFKINCSIDMTQIFLRRKILVVLLPALEKSIEAISSLGELITLQIAYAENKMAVKTHMQNIIIDEFVYFSKNINQFNLSETKNNYIFASQGFGYQKKEGFNYIMSHAKTHIGMKSEGSELPVALRLELMNNLSEMPKEVFGNGNGKYMDNLAFNLRDQREGEAIIFCLNKNVNNKDLLLINNENKYYTQKLNCSYIPAIKPKEIWLVDHSEPIIYIKK